jgi:hypothetical protein
VNPDDLCFAFILILHDVLGTKGTFRREHLKPEEWAQIEERMKCLFAMNRAKLFGGDENGSRKVRQA